MLSILRPAMVLPAALTFAGLASCSRKSQPECPYERTLPPPEERARTIAEMQSYKEKFGFDYFATRFNPKTIGDLNGNEVDDWLVLRSVKGGHSYCVDATVVIDMSERKFKEAKVDQLISQFLWEEPDLPGRTVHWHVGGKSGTELTPNDGAYWGPLLPGAVMMVRESKMTRLGILLNNRLAVQYSITSADWESCASKVEGQLRHLNLGETSDLPKAFKELFGGVEVDKVPLIPAP